MQRQYGSTYGSTPQVRLGELTAATSTENNQLSVTEVSVPSLGDVEASITVIDGGGRDGADCSSEAREEGDQTERNHAGLQ